MISEVRQRLNVRTIATSFKAAMESAPARAKLHRERSIELLDRARVDATDAIRSEIDDLHSQISSAGGERTG
jgi:hypothetical protein